MNASSGPASTLSGISNALVLALGETAQNETAAIARSAA